MLKIPIDWHKLLCVQVRLRTESRMVREALDVYIEVFSTDWLLTAFSDATGAGQRSAGGVAA
jgi:hypothetical protein